MMAAIGRREMGRERREIRTTFLHEPQLLSSVWKFTQVEPHNDGVGEAHATTTRQLGLTN